MGLKKATDINNKVRIFNEIREAQEAFENTNNPEDVRLNALEYIISHKDIFYILRILSELFKENNLKDHVYIDFAFATVVTIKPIKKGEKLTKENIWIKRPGTGEIKAEYYNKILGKIANNNIEVDKHIKWKDIK